MAIRFFDGADSQYIDNNGKTRLLNFNDEGVSLMTSPVPPLVLEVMATLEILEAPLKIALSFIKQRHLRITSQDGDPEDKIIQGLWVRTREDNSGIYYGYIPIASGTPAIKDVPFVESTKNDPLRTDISVSDLENFQRSRKIADFLKVYTLYTYALDPEKFGESTKAFVVKPNHIYDIEKLNKRLFAGPKNDVIYSNGKIIVLSQDIATNLLAYLNVALLNDRPGVMALADAATTDVYYRSVIDFRPAPNQLVFMGKASLMRWKREAEKNKNALAVSQILQKRQTGPYFYRNPKIRRNQLVIIQNVDGGSLEKAAAVADKWAKDRVNVGYAAENLADDVFGEIKKNKITTFTEDGEISKGSASAAEQRSVILYDDGSYAALLFLVK